MQRTKQVTTNIIIFIEIQVHLSDTVKSIYSPSDLKFIYSRSVIQLAQLVGIYNYTLIHYNVLCNIIIMQLIMI